MRDYTADKYMGTQTLAKVLTSHKYQSDTPARYELAI